MRESMEQAGLTPPLFESDRGNDQFVARYFFHHFLGAEDIAWLARFKDLHLSEDEAKALIVVREAGALNNSTYRELTKVDTLTASNPEGLSAMLADAQDAQRKALLNELPGALAARIGAIGQRHPPGEVCGAIVEVCRLRDWRAEELAILLQRHSRYVRNNYLRPLMRDGRLAMTHPNEPSDPQQAYRAVAAHL